MKSKKLLAAALAAVLTLAGCGTTVLSAEETKELLTLSQKTMATVESMAAEMTMEMDMSMGEETAETTTVAKILTQQNPPADADEPLRDLGGWHRSAEHADVRRGGGWQAAHLCFGGGYMV